MKTDAIEAAIEENEGPWKGQDSDAREQLVALVDENKKLKGIIATMLAERTEEDRKKIGEAMRMV